MAAERRSFSQVHNVLLRGWRSVLTWGLFCVPLSCAIPVMPTGGPVDKVPPVIVESDPTSESVNVDVDKIRLVFSEYIDQASFAQSVSITPEFDRPLVYRWKRRQVEIAFPEPLRDNTTYILSIDTNLKDANRVALTQPITFAFATGPVINRGRLSGRVLDANEGEGLASFDVFAYAMPDSTLPAELPEKPHYKTQTDQNGLFSLEYLSEQLYFVVALQDRNRNRAPDGPEPFAVPPKPVIQADSANTDSAGDWLVTSLDTIPPEVLRVRPISNRRLSVRFSESIRLLNRDPESWILQDSVSNQPIPVEEIYLYPEDPRLLFLKTASLFASPHTLVAGGIADSSGNPIVPDEIAFTPSANADTLQLRFLGFFLENSPTNSADAVMLSSSDGPMLQFNQSVPTDTLVKYVAVVDSNEQATVFDASTPNGSVYELNLPSDFIAGAPFSVRVEGSGFGAPDTAYTRIYQRMTEADLGELSGYVVAKDSTGQPVVQLYPAEGDSPEEVRTTAAEPDGRFIFSNLPAGSPFRFRAFLDLNADEQWNGGRILPYENAEPIVWHSDSLQVRARWEQSLPDTLRIPAR